MRVAMYYNNRDVRVEEMPRPHIGAGEVLVQVKACGICGTDVIEWYRLKKAPLVLGHELAGVIVAVGEGVERYKQGDRVTAAHHVPCNTCHYCRMGNHTVCDTLRTTHFEPGGFSEFVRLPAVNVNRGVFLLPDEVSFEEVTFVEPLACVLRAERRAGVRSGQTVLVLGSGIAGLLHIQLARAMGAARIVATDIVDYRIEQARRFGADLALLAEEDVPARIRQINDGRLADVVVVCASATKAFDQALLSVERGGTVLFFAPTVEGISFPISVNELFWRTQVTLTSSYAASPTDYAEALEWIRAGKVNVKDMITHRLSLDQVHLGFQLVTSGKESMKVIIEP